MTEPDQRQSIVCTNDELGVSLKGGQEVAVNVPYAILARPLVGPENPNREGSLEQRLAKNHLTGRLEEVSLPVVDFEEQRRSFSTHGFAADPDIPEKAVRSSLYIPGGNMQYLGASSSACLVDEDSKSLWKPPKKKRKPMGDPSDINGFSGPWAAYEDERGPGAVVGPSEDEQAAFLHEAAKTAPPVQTDLIEPGQERSLFHGSSERDYMGRTYMHVPQDLDMRLDKAYGDFDCFAPKKLVHTWTGHTKGVSAVRFFPVSGHLLLSASQDTRVKLWDVYQDRKCLRTFLGHNKPVRDINFNAAGGAFVSCGYDKGIKHWDTETGKCVTSIEYKAIPFCVKFNPDADKQHIILAGCADKRVVQWDLRSGQIVQEYNQHLDAVNSITFFDQNRRFVTTSDDKSVRVWEYDIPVTVKYIAEPEMHSMPAAALHPSGAFVAFQSLNNQVVVYSVQEKFQQRKKRFVGHSTAGYACQLGFSPDGKFLISGDGKGFLIVWDWKTGQLVRRIQAHDKVCIGVEWNPQETSRVATCSWDGTIKYWD